MARFKWFRSAETWNAATGEREAVYRCKEYPGVSIFKYRLRVPHEHKDGFYFCRKYFVESKRLTKEMGSMEECKDFIESGELARAIRNGI